MTCMRTSRPRLAALLHLGGPPAVSSPPQSSHAQSSSPPPAPSPSYGDPSAPGEDRTTYLVDLLKEAREELARADSKAALLLAATGVAVGALLAGLIGGKWMPFSLDNRVEWLWWFGVASVASG